MSTRPARGAEAGARANLVAHPTFGGERDGDGVPRGWYTDSPRAALRPLFGLDERGGRAGRRAATARGAGKALCFGKWGQVVPVVGGRHYEVGVDFRSEGIEDLHVNVLIALVWQLPGRSNSKSPTDHLSRCEPLGDGWLRARGVFRAPDACRSLDLELYLRFAPEGTVWWDSVTVEEVAPPTPRLAKLAAVRWRPEGPGTLERNLDEIGQVLDRAGSLGADLVCLPEMLNKAGMPDAAYAQVAEPLQGSTYRLLAHQARRYAMHVLGCIYEQDGDRIYNTAFLLDRAGALVGTYRKVHLYWPEEREGVSPGDAFPVLETDLGRVGIITCYDSWFPETARILGLKGAEVLLFPSAGYGEQQVLARSGDNGLYLVASALNSAAFISGPDGRVLARSEACGVVTATVDLNDRLTAAQNAGGTLNASPGGALASRHAPSLRLYREILEETHFGGAAARGQR